MAIEDARSAISLVNTVALPAYHKEKTRLDLIHRYLRGDHPNPYVPRGATSEYRLLVKRAISNFLPLIVSAAVQGLYVEGYRGTTTNDNAPVWKVWQANCMDARQIPLHRAAVAYGHAYTTVLPGILPTGEDTATIQAYSPRSMVALYDDPAEDEWPEYGLSVQVQRVNSVKSRVMKLWDEVGVHTLIQPYSGGKTVYSNFAAHNLGVTPIIRYANEIDLDGNTLGVVEPIMGVQDRANQSIFDLLIAQTFSSTKVRTVSGMEPPVEREPDGTPLLDEAGQQIPKRIKMGPDRLLMAADPETKWSQLDESPLAPFIESVEMTVDHMFTISQTPPHYGPGKIANISAEALASAESGRTRNLTETQHVLGESHEKMLRLASVAAKIPTAATDQSSQVVWGDIETRSLSQTADALGKISSLLFVPPEGLWSKIPGVTDQDIAYWKTLVKQNDAITRLANLVEQGPAKPPEPDAPVDSSGEPVGSGN